MKNLRFRIISQVAADGLITFRGSYPSLSLYNYTTSSSSQSREIIPFVFWKFEEGDLTPMI